MTTAPVRSFVVRMAAVPSGPTPEEYALYRDRWRAEWSSRSGGMGGVECAAASMVPALGVGFVVGAVLGVPLRYSFAGSVVLAVLSAALVLWCAVRRPGLDRTLVRPVLVFLEEAGGVRAAPGWTYHHPDFGRVRRHVRRMRLPADVLEVFEVLAEDSTLPLPVLVESARALTRP